MGNDNKKIVAVSFVCAGILTAIVANLLLDVLASTFGVVARLQDYEIFRHGLPVALGLAAYLSLQLRPSMQLWADEVVSEIRKVVWPSRRDTFAMTVVVCVLLVVSGVAVYACDQISTFLIEKIIGR